MTIKVVRAVKVRKYMEVFGGEEHFLVRIDDSRSLGAAACWAMFCNRFSAMIYARALQAEFPGNEIEEVS